MNGECHGGAIKGNDNGNAVDGMVQGMGGEAGEVTLREGASDFGEDVGDV